MLDPRRRTAQRKDKSPDEVEHQQERFHPGLFPSRATCRSPVRDRPDRPPYGASQARAATINASTPVCKVGWITGAKRGLWLVGISLSRPACLAFA
jgi:hypothetical protein